jgi:hypothetical protein
MTLFSLLLVTVLLVEVNSVLDDVGDVVDCAVTNDKFGHLDVSNFYFQDCKPFDLSIIFMFSIDLVSLDSPFKRFYTRLVLI